MEPEATYQRQAERREQIGRVLELASAIRFNRHELSTSSFHNAIDQLADLAAEALLALAVAERERDQARQALRGVVAVLGPQAPEHGCDGCTAEMAEALRIARAALAEVPQT